MSVGAIIAIIGAGAGWCTVALLVARSPGRTASPPAASPFDVVVEHLPLGVAVLTVPADAGAAAPLVVAAVNTSALQLLGADRAVVGQPASALIGANADVRAALVEVVRTRLPRHLDRAEMDSADGRILAVDVVPIADGVVGMIIEDVTDQAVAAAALRHQALHDGLTGLPNRARLMERVREVLGAARRNHSKCALLVVDLNHFKAINDRLGHDHGDALLAAFANRLRSALRDCDLIARIGGDEFALVVEDASLGAASLVAQKVLACVADAFEINGRHIEAGASIGIALFPDHATDAETLVKRADIAMYAAKRDGLGTAVYEPEQDRSSVQRLTLVSELRTAIDHDELRLVYQPVYDNRANRVDRVEGLVRWMHPRHGNVPPREFIELAEAAGIIRQFGRWTLASALAPLTALDDVAPALGVSLSISQRNLHEPAFVDDVVELLAGTPVQPWRLGLELTERDLMMEPSLATEVLSQLHDIGVRTIIDEFGVGHASLSFLQTLPVDEIKVDRSLVAQMSAGDEGAAMIVRSIIETGTGLGWDITADGVQTEPLRQELAKLGCTKFQGFAIGRPMAIDELTQWLRSERARSA